MAHFTDFIVPRILGQGHGNLTILIIIPIIQFIKFGLNPSMGGGRGTKFDIQRAGVTMKMRSRSP